MYSTTPTDLGKVKKENIDKEILRAAIIGELDTVNLYEQLADLTANEDIKADLLDIAREEKEHIGELQAILLKLDPEQAEKLVSGKKEVEELIGKK
jgi:rubrerythrin